MPLTKDFKATVMARAHRDIEFYNIMLIEAISEFLTGNVELGEVMFRDCWIILNLNQYDQPILKLLRCQ